MTRNPIKSTLGLAALLLASTAAQAADPVFKTLLSFDAATHGTPVARPIWAGGAIYGTTRIGSTTTGVLYKVDPSTGALTLVHSFEAAPGGPANHYPLVLGQDGALYGTRSATVVTATATGDEASVGQLYRLPLSGPGAGSLSFSPLRAADGTGFGPVSALFQAANGKFYGATYSELFEVNADGSNPAVFYKAASFSSNGIVGISEAGSLIASYGFSQSSGGINAISIASKELVQVATGITMSVPTGMLVRGADGALYGTDKNSRVVKLTDQAGSLQTVYTFTSEDSFTWPDGMRPQNYLTLGYDGMLYGVASPGGDNDKGTLFRINPTAAEGARFTKLHDFTAAQGSSPTGLTQGKDGKLYGTTSADGANGVGTLFSIDVGIVPPAPSVTAFTATPASVTVDSPAKLAWTSANAAACRVTATGYDSGALGATGEVSVTPTAAATVEYTVTCTGSGDFAADTATQKVSLTATLRSGGGGGAMGPGLLLMAGALALWRRRSRQA